MIIGMRRGACPDLVDPMQTGDGLLVRLPASDAPRPLSFWTALCDAAAEHGSGILEISRRGGVQARGLTPDSAPRFAAALRAAGIEPTAPPAIDVSPLGG